MDWQSFESKLLASSSYDGTKHTLYLRFRSGEVYRYFEFPAEQYREFLDAESHGRYFLNHIRNHYRYERMAKLRAA
jgi:KTSC domain-containing protein